MNIERARRRSSGEAQARPNLERQTGSNSYSDSKKIVVDIPTKEEVTKLVDEVSQSIAKFITQKRGAQRSKLRIIRKETEISRQEDC